jgi:hypothetical protein
MPDDWRYIIHALVIRDDDKGLVFRDLMLLGESVPGTQDIGAPHQDEVEKADAFLVGAITEHVKAYPLNGMEDEQGEPKNQEIKQC